MRIVLIFGMVAVFLVPLYPAAGQNCDTLIAHGLRNVEIEKSTLAMDATKYYRNCGIDYHSKTDDQLATIEVEVFGYGKGNGGYSRSQREEDLRQWCVTSAESARRGETLYRESQTILGSALDAWVACNALLHDSVQTYPQITNDQKTVDLSISYRGDGTRLFWGVTAKNFTCDVRVPGLVAKEVAAVLEAKGVELKLQPVSIHCERAPAVSREINGQRYQWLDRATISVRAASTPFQLFFPEQTDPSLPEKLAQRLEDEISEIRRVTVPVGAVMPFFLTPAEVASLAPAWLPSDGRTIADAESPLNGQVLPNLSNRFVLGAPPTEDVRPDGPNSGGSLDFDVTTEPLASGTDFLDENGNPGDQGAKPRFVIDTFVDERLKANHKHRVLLRNIVPPYRRLVYLVRVR